MQPLILIMIVAILSFQYLVSINVLPSQASYTPEIIALLAAIPVVIVGVKSRFQYVRPVYWLVFGGVSVVLVCGAIANMLEPGPLFAGLRTYLRALPLFFLPAILQLKERQLKVQLLLLLALCIVQVPLAWQQREATRAYGGWTGDLTFGTLLHSGVLSVFLICAACVLTGMYLRRKIPLLLYLLLVLIVLVPTTLNETKITFVLLPVALMITLYAGSAKGKRLKNGLVGLVIVTVFLAIFIPIYNSFMPYWDIVGFATEDNQVGKYLLRDVEIGDRKTEAGRLDGVVAAVSVLARDPASLAFGLGIGNAAESALGPQFTGAYYSTFSTFPFTSFMLLFLDQGLLGVVLVLLLHWLIFADTLWVASRDNGLIGALAIGWAGVGFIIVASLPYIEVVANAALSYLYWYYSGVIASQRMRAIVAAKSTSHNNETTRPVARNYVAPGIGT